MGGLRTRNRRTGHDERPRGLFALRAHDRFPDELVSRDDRGDPNDRIVHEQVDRFIDEIPHVEPTGLHVLFSTAREAQLASLVSLSATETVVPSLRSVVGNVDLAVESGCEASLNFGVFHARVGMHENVSRKGTASRCFAKHFGRNQVTEMAQLLEAAPGFEREHTPMNSTS